MPEGRPDIVGLEQRYTPPLRSAPAPPPDQGDIAAVAPVEGLLHRGITHLLKQ